MAKGDRGSRGRSEYGSGSDHRRGTTYRDRDRADRNRDRYEQNQRERDEQRKREESARREAERQESERKIREAQQRRSQEERTRQADERRSAVSGQTSGFGSVIDRIGGIFSSDDATDITDSSGDVVAQSFTVDEPTQIQTIDFGENTSFETAVPDANPYSEYAGTVVDQGSIGGTQQEQQVQQDIYAAGRQAQAEDVFGTLATAAAGPIGAAPGFIADTVRYFQDDPIQQAGEELYESGKVNIPGASTAIGLANAPGLGAAFDVANSVFGGSRNLEAFREKAGIKPEPSQMPFTQGNDSDRQYASNIPPIQQPAQQVAPTMADGFQMASWDQNIYSDYLNNFFKGA